MLPCALTMSLAIFKPMPKPDAVKWVQVDLGRSPALDRVVLWGCHDDFNGIGAGFGFPVRFRVEVSDDPAFQAYVQDLAGRLRTVNGVARVATYAETGDPSMVSADRHAAL